MSAFTEQRNKRTFTNKAERRAWLEGLVAEHLPASFGGSARQRRTVINQLALHGLGGIAVCKLNNDGLATIKELVSGPLGVELGLIKASEMTAPKIPKASSVAPAPSPAPAPAAPPAPPAPAPAPALSPVSSWGRPPLPVLKIERSTPEQLAQAARAWVAERRAARAAAAAGQA